MVDLYMYLKRLLRPRLKQNSLEVPVANEMQTVVNSDGRCYLEPSLLETLFGLQNQTINYMLVKSDKSM